MTPVCPHHQKEMRAGKGGSYYCPSKDQNGEWCKFKAPAPASAPAPNGSASSPAPASSSQARYIAALEFSATVYRGVGPEMSDDALAFALRVYQSFPA